MKTCTKCLEEKNIDDFITYRYNDILKHKTICKSCTRIKQRINARRRRLNPEYVKKQNERRKYIRDSNITGYKERYKKHYAEVREKKLARAKQYHKEKPEVRKRAIDKARISGKTRKKSQEERDNLTDSYIIALLTQYNRKRFNYKEDWSYYKKHPQLIQLKRTELLLKRQIYGNPKEKNQKHEGLD